MGLRPETCPECGKPEALPNHDCVALHEVNALLRQIEQSESFDQLAVSTLVAAARISIVSHDTAVYAEDQDWEPGSAFQRCSCEGCKTLRIALQPFGGAPNWSPYPKDGP